MTGTGTGTLTAFAILVPFERSLSVGCCCAASEQTDCTYILLLYLVHAKLQVCTQRGLGGRSRLTNLTRVCRPYETTSGKHRARPRQALRLVRSSFIGCIYNQCTSGAQRTYLNLFVGIELPVSPTSSLHSAANCCCVVPGTNQIWMCTTLGRKASKAPAANNRTQRAIRRHEASITLFTSGRRSSPRVPAGQQQRAKMSMKQSHFDTYPEKNLKLMCSSVREERGALKIYAHK